ncbi:unnamed protein product [Cylicostephanus goldi]|uniref:Peptidase C1A papain C-terminal domain-containing protein n=1 Tax=Cylicostephanus goldi TaxID=71465 RepID=A0A3P6RS23_CYLGO|nr:unnamed protein product [Cylicostephanus goldi]
MLGVEEVWFSARTLKSLSSTRFLNISLPDEFDARAWWPACESIGFIRDQSSCGSCWAFGAVEAMSDRICIASRGNITPTLSADDVLACCESCGYGCRGGYPDKAWEYWVENGVVTGGEYKNNVSTMYPFSTNRAQRQRRFCCMK